MNQSLFHYLVAYYRRLRKLAGRRFILLVLFSWMSTLFESLGISLFFPLLNLNDLKQSENTDAVTRFVRQTLEILGLPLTIGSILGVISAIFFLKALAEFQKENFLVRLRADVIDDLRTRVIHTLGGVNYLHFAKKKAGLFSNLLTVEVPRVSDAFYLYGVVCSQLVTIGTFLVVSAVINLQFTFLALVLGIISWFSLRWMGGLARSISRDGSEKNSELSGQIIQSIHHFKYLISTRRFPVIERRMRDAGSVLKHFAYKLGTMNALSRVAAEPLTIFALVGLIYYQAVILEKSLTLIMVALVLFNRCARNILSFQSTWQSFCAVMGSLDYVSEAFEDLEKNQECSNGRNPPVFEKAIEFKKVSFAYGERKEVLSEVDLVFPKNFTSAIVGPSGVGKSTLVDLLTGILQPTHGQVTLDGHNLNDVDKAMWRSRIGYVTQENVIFDDSIEENIVLGEVTSKTPEDTQAILEAAKQAHAEEFIQNLPEGAATRVGDRGSQLSGGQRQRLAIARELFRKPELLILDEATSALDVEAEKMIKRTIDHLKGTTTIVIITHRLSTIQNADFVFVLGGGKVIESGTYAELSANSNSRLQQMKSNPDT